MKPEDLAGIALIGAVIVAATWLIAASPDYDAMLKAKTLDRPTPIGCVWAQPWDDPAFVMDGWSQPQSWWHEPAIDVLWSNARTADIMFHLGRSTRPVDIAIKYVAVSTDVEVLVNDKRAGMLDRKADGDHAAHVLLHRLSSLPSDGVVDVRFRVGDAVMHPNDGRYLGVLLQAIRVCTAN